MLVCWPIIFSTESLGTGTIFPDSRWQCVDGDNNDDSGDWSGLMSVSHDINKVRNRETSLNWRRGMQCIFDSLSSDNFMISNLKWLSLFSKFIIPYQLRDDNEFIQPLTRTTSFGIKYFAYFGIHLWNMLPQHIKTSVSLYNFKSLIRKWSGPTCCCSVCTQVVWFRYCLYKSILWHMFSSIYSVILRKRCCHL